jgi:choline kinase
VSTAADRKSAAACGVVLAAGRSQRLASVTHDRSKALLRVGPRTLLEHALHTLRVLGATRTVIAVGYDSDLVRTHALSSRARRVEVVEVVEADGWEAGNGSSLAATREAVGDEHLFWLMVCDHVFDPAAIALLALTTRPAALLDPAPSRRMHSDGTRAVVQHGYVVAFGKHLVADPIDCGIFLVPTAIFEAQAAASDRSDFSLAGALTALTRTHPLHAVWLPGGARWADVDTPSDLRRAARLAAQHPE